MILQYLHYKKPLLDRAPISSCVFGEGLLHDPAQAAAVPPLHNKAIVEDHDRQATIGKMFDHVTRNAGVEVHQA